MKSRTAEVKNRSDILHQLARNYVTEGLGKKNFDAIPYDNNVSLRAPILPGGSKEPLKGREKLRTVWWKPLPDLIEDVKIFDTFVNKDLTQVTVEFHCFIKDPKCTLRIVDRFKVNGNNNIVEQENFFDPREIT